MTHAPHKNFSAPLNSGVTHIICPDLLRLFFRSVVSPKRMAVRLPPTWTTQEWIGRRMRVQRFCAPPTRMRCALRLESMPSETP